MKYVQVDCGRDQPQRATMFSRRAILGPSFQKLLDIEMIHWLFQADLRPLGFVSSPLVV